MNPVHIILDESGTPGIADHPFVTAGIAIYGDCTPVESAWNELSIEEKLPKKAKRYSRDNWLSLVDFVLRYRLLPICTSHCLDLTTATALRERTMEFPNHRGPQGLTKLNHAHYVWYTHVLLTVAQSLISVIRQMGSINAIRVQVDQFPITAEIRSHVVAQFSQMFSHDGVFQGFLKQRSRDYEGFIPLSEMYCETVSGFQVGPNDVSIDLNAAGGLHRLSDAVASMIRSAKTGDQDAAIAWEQLRAAYKDRTIIDFDLTPMLTVTSTLPWPSSHGNRVK